MRTSTLCLLLLWAVADLPAATENGAPAAHYQLTVVSDRVSLRVQDGSVVQLTEDLGCRSGFEVIAQGVDDARVTLDFQNLTLSEAIRAICKTVGYVEVPDGVTGRTVRLVLTPRRSTKNRSDARREPLAPRPEPPAEPLPAPAPDPSPANPARPDDDDDTTP